MRIGINGRHLGPNKSGVGRYLISLLQQWQQAPHGHEFLVYTSNEQLQPEDLALFRPGSAIIHRRMPRPLGSFHLWYNFSLTRAMIHDKVDWFFSPDYFCPPFLPRRIQRSMTIHDVSYLAHPEWFPLLYRVYGQLFSKIPATSADLIITVSRFSEEEIMRYTKVPRSRITIIPEAADERFKPNDSSGTLPPEITGSFFLYVGKIFNRRHVHEMLLAFKNYLIEKSDTTTQFIIRGRDETHPAQHIDRLVANINATMGRSAIICLAYCSDQQLIQLYQRAKAFFYLSDYEGFGLPVLEALACGTPTVTVEQTSIPEVTGQAAIYVDPVDIPGLTAIMDRLVHDHPWRAEKRQQSLQQAKKFSWSISAESTLTRIERLYNSSRP